VDGGVGSKPNQQPLIKAPKTAEEQIAGSSDELAPVNEPVKKTQQELDLAKAQAQQAKDNTIQKAAEKVGQKQSQKDIEQQVVNLEGADAPTDLIDQYKAKLGDNKIPQWQDALTRFNSEIIGLPKDVYKGFAQSMEAVGDVTNQQWLKDSAIAAQRDADKAMQSVRNTLGQNPYYDNDFTSQVASGLGQMANQVGLAMATGGTSALEGAASKFGAREAADLVAKKLFSPQSMAAALPVFTQSFDEAKQNGVSGKEAWAYATRNAGVTAATAFLPVEDALNRVGAATQKPIFDYVKNSAAVGFEERVQESAEQAFQNLNAQQTFDATRNIWDGVMDAGNTGQAVGTIIGGLLGLPRMFRAKAKSTTNQTDKEYYNSAADLLEKADTQIDANDPNARIEWLEKEKASTDNPNLQVAYDEAIGKAKEQLPSYNQEVVETKIANADPTSLNDVNDILDEVDKRIDNGGFAENATTENTTPSAPEAQPIPSEQQPAPNEQVVSQEQEVQQNKQPISSEQHPVPNEQGLATEQETQPVEGVPNEQGLDTKQEGLPLEDANSDTKTEDNDIFKKVRGYFERLYKNDKQFKKQFDSAIDDIALEDKQYTPETKAEWREKAFDLISENVDVSPEKNVVDFWDKAANWLAEHSENHSDKITQTAAVIVANGINRELYQFKKSDIASSDRIRLQKAADLVNITTAKLGTETARAFVARQGVLKDPRERLKQLKYTTEARAVKRISEKSNKAIKQVQNEATQSAVNNPELEKRVLELETRAKKAEADLAKLKAERSEKTTEQRKRLKKATNDLWDVIDKEGLLDKNTLSANLPVFNEKVVKAFGVVVNEAIKTGLVTAEEIAANIYEQKPNLPKEWKEKILEVVRDILDKKKFSADVLAERLKSHITDNVSKRLSESLKSGKNNKLDVLEVALKTLIRKYNDVAKDRGKPLATNKDGYLRAIGELFTRKEAYKNAWDKAAEEVNNWLTEKYGEDEEALKNAQEILHDYFKSTELGYDEFVYKPDIEKSVRKQFSGFVSELSKSSKISKTSLLDLINGSLDKVKLSADQLRPLINKEIGRNMTNEEFNNFKKHYDNVLEFELRKKAANQVSSLFTSSSENAARKSKSMAEKISNANSLKDYIDLNSPLHNQLNTVLTNYYNSHVKEKYQGLVKKASIGQKVKKSELLDVLKGSDNTLRELPTIVRTEIEKSVGKKMTDADFEAFKTEYTDIVNNELQKRAVKELSSILQSKLPSKSTPNVIAKKIAELFLLNKHQSENGDLAELFTNAMSSLQEKHMKQEFSGFANRKPNKDTNSPKPRLIDLIRSASPKSQQSPYKLRPLIEEHLGKPMSEEDFTKFKEQYNDILNKEVQKRVGKELDNLLKVDENLTPKQKKTFVEKLSNYFTLHHGIGSNTELQEKFHQVLKEVYHVNQLTDDQLSDAIRLAEELTKIEQITGKQSEYKVKAAELDAIVKNPNITWQDKLNYLQSGNILFEPFGRATDALSNVVMTGLSTASSVASIPSKAFIKAVPYLMQSGVKRGLVSAKLALQGKTPTNMRYDASKNTASYEEIGDSFKGIFSFAKALNYVGRVMNATDALITEGPSIQLKTALLLLNHDPDFANLDSDQKVELLKKKLEGTKEQREQAQKEVIESGVYTEQPYEEGKPFKDYFESNTKALQAERAVSEAISNRNIEEDVTVAAVEEALHNSFKNDPHGTLGLLWESLFNNKIMKGNPVGKSFARFSRTAFNIINTSLDYTALGYFRAYGMQLGTLINKNSNVRVDKESKYYKTLQREAIGRANLGTIAGGAIAALLIALCGDDEPEDSVFDITGNFSGLSRQQLQNLQQMGIPKNSIKIAGQWIPIKYFIPFMVPFSLMGNFNDLRRFGKKDDEEAQLTMQAMGMNSIKVGTYTALSLLDQSPIKGYERLFTNLGYAKNKQIDGNELAKQAMSEVVNQASTAVVPMFVKNALNQYLPAMLNMDVNMYARADSKDLTSSIAYQTGLGTILRASGVDLKSKRDVFGHEYEMVAGEYNWPILSVLRHKDRPELKMAWLSGIKPTTSPLTMVYDRKERKERKATPEEIEQIDRAVAEALKPYVGNNGIAAETLREYDKTQDPKILTKYSARITAIIQATRNKAKRF
jgi:hypothetical protein